MISRAGVVIILGLNVRDERRGGINFPDDLTK